MPDAALIQQFYIPEQVHLWKSLLIEGGKPLEVDTKALGFVPVYDKLEDLQKDFPGVDHITMVKSIQMKQSE